nr:MAG TPA: hypothetical protein [Caudoviricetes sp.]
MLSSWLGVINSFKNNLKDLSISYAVFNRRLKRL